MGWGHACWHASAYVLAIMALLSVTLVAVDLSSKRSCVHHPLSSEFRSFAVCLLFCAVIMVIKVVIKERFEGIPAKLHSVTLSVTRTLPSLVPDHTLTISFLVKGATLQCFQLSQAIFCIIKDK